MPTIEITIGWTKSSLPEYSSFCDGYKPGAEQHTETIEVEWSPKHPEPDWGALEVAEACFIATNSPYEVTGLAAEIRSAIAATGYDGRGAHYSLSVGDTVTVGEVMLACANFGWERVFAGVTI